MYLLINLLFYSKASKKTDALSPVTVFDLAFTFHDFTKEKIRSNYVCIVLYICYIYIFNMNKLNSMHINVIIKYRIIYYA